MLNAVCDLVINISNNLIPSIFLSPVIAASSLIFYNLYDIIFNANFLSEEKILNMRKNELIFTIKNNFNHILNLDHVQFRLKISTIEGNIEFFNKIKELTILYKDDNYSFFIGQLRGNFKNTHLDLLKKLNSNISFKDFIKEKYSEELLEIICKKLKN